MAEELPVGSSETRDIPTQLGDHQQRHHGHAPGPAMSWKMLPCALHLHPRSSSLQHVYEYIHMYIYIYVYMCVYNIFYIYTYLHTSIYKSTYLPLKKKTLWQKKTCASLQSQACNFVVFQV